MTSVFDPEPVRNARKMGRLTPFFGCGRRLWARGASLKFARIRYSGYRAGMGQRVALAGYAAAGAASSAPTNRIFGGGFGRRRGAREDRPWRLRGRVGRAVAHGQPPPALLVALISADPKPNFHRNNDRKQVGGMQGLGGCGLFKFLRSKDRFSGTAELYVLRHSIAGEQVKIRTLHKPKGSAPRTGWGSFVLKWWCGTIRPAVRSTGEGIETKGSATRQEGFRHPARIEGASS